MNTQATATRGVTPTAAPTATTVANYLLTRLSQAGVVSFFGVPGDYNLGILDAIERGWGLSWQGMATEQGAGYAADSYARLRGLGVVVTTFGVGELSAINAIAGAYAESVPVVHIVGTPALTARNADMTSHHNLPGGDFGHFARMAAEVTAAQADLRPATAAAEIDRVLTTAVRTSRPVYIAIPADVAAAPVPAPEGRLPRVGDVDEEVAAAEPAVLAAFAAHARSLLDTAASAGVLLGHLAARFRVTEAVRDLAAAGGVPVAVLATAKGDFPESDPRFAGLYAGAASAKRARVVVEDRDVLITVGVAMSDTVPGGGTHQLPAARRIDLSPGQARIGSAVYPGVGMRTALAIVTAAVRGCAGRLTTGLLPEREPGASVSGARLSQRALWAILERFLEPGDMVLADAGTAFYGAAELTLPDGAQLLGQPLWASLGWATPAAVGATLGAPDRRLILVVGDGAAQQAASELGTLLALGLAPIVIVLNNNGYTTERAFGSPSAWYHDIPSWDWTALPAALSPEMSPLTRQAASPRGFDRALRSATRHAGRPVVIEAVLDREDAPPLLTDMTRALADGGSRR
jgi:indolepyruvate decarboxylase